MTTTNQDTQTASAVETLTAAIEAGMARGLTYDKAYRHAVAEMDAETMRRITETFHA
jgi:hypothetical protein